VTLITAGFNCGSAFGFTSAPPAPITYAQTGAAGSSQAVLNAAVRRPIPGNLTLAPAGYIQAIFPLRSGGRSVIRQAVISKPYRTFDGLIELSPGSHPMLPTTELTVWATSLPPLTLIADVSAAILDGRCQELPDSLPFGADGTIPLDLEVPVWATGICVVSSYAVEAYTTQFALAGMANRDRLPYWQCGLTLSVDVR
jgi:hypothetical protein